MENFLGDNEGRKEDILSSRWDSTKESVAEVNKHFKMMVDIEHYLREQGTPISENDICPQPVKKKSTPFSQRFKMRFWSEPKRGELDRLVVSEEKHEHRAGLSK